MTCLVSLHSRFNEIISIKVPMVMVVIRNSSRVNSILFFNEIVSIKVPVLMVVVRNSSHVNSVPFFNELISIKAPMLMVVVRNPSRADFIEIVRPSVPYFGSHVVKSKCTRADDI
mmetsp:Transcript_17539/g.43466  ORF Transcript_17539/g.43466 Transcript_17539/m.43466 type:complete len:115 (+) Transcript_17539:1836-2180(+)